MVKETNLATPQDIPFENVIWKSEVTLMDQKKNFAKQEIEFSHLIRRPDGWLWGDTLATDS